MDFGIGSVTAITAICYLGGMACKATTKVKDEVIPVVCGLTGGILGVAGMYLMPEFPATDVINAAAIGIVSVSYTHLQMQGTSYFCRDTKQIRCRSF